MSRAKHRPPSPLVIAYNAHRRHAIDVLLSVALALPVAAVYAAGVDVAPDARNAASAQPTVEVREPTGHGGDVGPLATPSIGADGAWQPEDGPVIVDGTPLETPEPITPPPVEVAPQPVTETTALPPPLEQPEPVPPATEEPASTVTEPTPEPTDDPVAVPPEDPEVTEPEVTDPEVTDPEVTDPPAEPTTPVVEVAP